MTDEMLAAFLADFPDDAACTLLATLGDSGTIVRDGCSEVAFAYWTQLGGAVPRDRRERRRCRAGPSAGVECVGD